MAYVSLYRKYRPQTFDEVVGQEHVTTTVKNAISAGRVGSGYLFTGTRGTAKTTCARILAKALNCIGEDGTGTSPTPTPCGVCIPCRGIAASAFVDVLEMDAASHGKVDDVRDLVASIKFPPMEGRYKVYIIDEAHQLSRDAMDAFLKTLEEPPDRVVFVLATTELEKLPITIASRCQVFEFKRGSVAAISSRLNAVLAAEGVAADSDAVTLIARAADGSYRDSLSLLEQVLAYKPTAVSVADVSLVLGIVDDDALTDIVAKIAAHDPAGAFAAADSITSAGKDVRQFIRTLSTRLRDMLFVAVGAHTADVDVTEAARAQASTLSQGVLLRALQLLSETERDMRWSNQHRLVLEITLLRLCALTDDGVVASSPPVRPALRPASATPAARATPPPEKPAVPHPIPESIASNGAAYVSHAVPEVKVVQAADEEESDLVEDSDEESVVDEIVEDVETAVVPNETNEPDLLTVQQVADSPVLSRPAAMVSNGPPELVRLQKAWSEVINRMGSRSPSGATTLKDATPLELNGTVFTLQFSSPFHFERSEKNERGRKAIEDVINRTLGVEPETYRIRCVLAGRATPDVPATARQSTAPSAPPHEEPGSLMDEVIAVFGGQVLEE